MKGRYLETFFRHRIAVCLPVVVALLGAVAYVVLSGRSYQSTVDMWADNPLPAASSIDQATNGVTPAGQEASVLTELLTTRSFAYDVASHSQLGLQHESATQLIATLQKQVAVSTPGPQILRIAATAPTSPEAVGTARAVAKEFSAQLSSVRSSRAQALVSYYSSQLNLLSQQLTQAEQQVSSYVASHPGASANGSDTNLTSLTSAVTSAQEQYQSVQAKYSQASAGLQEANAGSVSRVIDGPQQPAVAQSRKKRIIFAGVGGLVGGLVVSILVLLALTATDGAIRRKEDLEQEPDLQVVGVINQFRRTGRTEPA